MYLKKIIANGFKSFADNTQIDLDRNIAGIVGPNGSGKSNVVDAVRWVLGEQSVKSLRGEGGMTDVIFAGSKSRKPMNSASVTLVFDNSDNYLNISYDEVSIKRRLYSDGVNEYYINNEKVRLKDISNLLMDSGIAKESFNIISQGKIEEILSNKPEDRRIIFEEAAGVLKYKKRKEEATRKLEKTHDNINRVNDIIKELENQIEPLREQKKVAILYNSLNEELRNLDISLVAFDITNINNKFQENKKRIDILKEEILNISTSNSITEARSMEYKSLISSLEKQIQSNQDKLLDVIKKSEQANSRKQIILERKKYELSEDTLHASLIEYKEEELKLKNELNTYYEELKFKEEEFNNINKEITNLEVSLAKIKSDKSKYDYDLNTSLKNLSILNSKIESLKFSIENNSLVPDSVKKVLNNPKLRGIVGTISSLIEVDEKYSTAISVLIQSSSSFVVTENEICAKEAIEYLKNNNIGRVTFFPLNIIKDKFIDDNTLKILTNSEGFIDIASSLIKYDKKYENIIKNQLGNVIIVDNIENANKISKKINYKYKIATIAGEVLHVGGSLTGGKIKVRNIITDKYELEKMLIDFSNSENNIKNIENKINEFDYNFKSVEDKLYLLEKEKIKLENYITLKKNTITNINIKCEDLEEKIKGTNNIIDNKLSEEEDYALKEYYSLIKEQNSISVTLESLKNKKLKLESELDDFEHSIKKDNSIYNEKKEELKNLEIEVNRGDVKLDNLLNYLNENYQMTYENAIKLYRLEVNEAEARSKVSSLKHQIKNLGPVNLNSINEYDKVSERYEFLINQQEDLVSAENTLLTIIEEMDSVMKDEFLKTFEIISSNFEYTFKELFKGGSAKLLLTNKEDILQTGIEIIASPPGKSLKSISLLSGGEKTFTAISLLFAILQSRPVPFCILDEVEAALDEVNVDAFGEYITKLKDKTQFIIITHKKKTMEYADVLYGITMQESGVSKLVSVKLEEIK